MCVAVTNILVHRVGRKTWHFYNMNSIAKIGRSTLTRLFCSEVLPSAEPTFPVQPIDLDVQNDIGYMSEYNEERVGSGKGYILYSYVFGLVHVEFERDGETLFDGVVRCIREKGLSMPHFIIVATWPHKDDIGTSHTYTAYRITRLQERLIRYAAVMHKIHNSRPVFLSGLQVFKP